MNSGELKMDATNAYREALLIALQEVAVWQEQYETLRRDWLEQKKDISSVSQELQISCSGELGPGNWAENVVRILKAHGIRKGT